MSAAAWVLLVAVSTVVLLFVGGVASAVVDNRRNGLPLLSRAPLPGRHAAEYDPALDGPLEGCPDLGCACRDEATA